MCIVICNCYDIFYKGLEHPWIWVSTGVLEPIPEDTNCKGLGEHCSLTRWPPIPKGVSFWTSLSCLFIRMDIWITRLAYFSYNSSSFPLWKLRKPESIKN